MKDNEIVRYSIWEDGMQFYSEGRVIMIAKEWWILADKDDNLKAIHQNRIISSNNTENKE